MEEPLMAAQHQPRALVAGETESACTYQDSSRLHLQVRVLNIFRYAAPKVGKGPERRAEIAKSRANIPAAKWGIRAR